MWTAIINTILSIIANITSIWSNKCKDTSITNNENAKKLQERKDENNKLINDACNGDKESLEVIRKRASE